MGTFGIFQFNRLLPFLMNSSLSKACLCPPPLAFELQQGLRKVAIFLLIWQKVRNGVLDLVFDGLWVCHGRRQWLYKDLNVVCS